MLPFICIKEESDVDPKIAKKFPGLNFLINICVTFCTINDAVIAGILDTEERAVFRRGSNHFVFLSMI
jgi:hypothetical protein